MRYLKYLVVALLLIVGLSTPATARALQVNAAAGILYNPNTQEILWQQNATVQRPIASLTKMMTAWVFYSGDPDLSAMVTITRADVAHASTTHLRAADRVSVDDLLHLMLIGSDNAAARALARVATKGFVARMNAAAVELGLLHTHYVEPSGLSRGNVSTAEDIAHLLSVVASQPSIAHIMRMKSYTLQIGKRFVFVQSTNHLLRDPALEVLAGKTGYTGPAGFCVATELRTGFDANVVFVVLGAKTNEGRFNEVRNILDWANQTFTDVTKVTPGLPVGLLSIGRVCVFPERVSATGVDFIKSHEAFRSRPYRDPAHVWTVGYGFTTWHGRHVTSRYPRSVSRAAADEEFTRQLKYYEVVVQQSVCSHLTQSAYDSLVSLAWNLGRVNTSIVEKLTFSGAGDVDEVDFLSTATVRGRINPGLLTRRAHEFAMFSGSDKE